MKAKPQESSKTEKLQVIEDNTFDMGNHAYKSFSKSKNLSSLRGAVMSYRCSMQAMRDKMRYTLKK